MCDYFFVTRKPSSIALASILNALDIVHPSLAEAGISSVAMKRSLLRQIKKNAPDLDLTATLEIAECRIRLKSMYEEALLSQQMDSYQSDADTTASPTAVVSDDEGHHTFGKRQRY